MKVRYAIKFTKESDIKFISHLDLMRTIQRIIRRAELPIEYSKGFNPHMNLSIAQPLPVGIYSVGEYMDIVLTEELSEEQIIQSLRECAPTGIKFIKVIKVMKELSDKKIPQIMALLDAAAYSIRIAYEDVSELQAEINDLLNKDQWVTTKKSKSGERELDIKPLVKEFKYKIEGHNIEIEALLACGSRENLSAELFSEYVKSNTSKVKANSFVDIGRKEMYTLSGEKLISIDTYFE